MNFLNIITGGTFLHSFSPSFYLFFVYTLYISLNSIIISNVPFHVRRLQFFFFCGIYDLEAIIPVFIDL